MNEPYDVFISYARDDAARAQIVRDRLEALGLRVFFDAEGIDSGQEFPIVIDRAVKTAKCVLGLWSQNAFDGRWVRIESRIGLDQGKLVAGMIDGTRPEDLPAEFYNVNVENLANFHGQADHPGWNRILRVIGKRVGRSDLGPRPAAAPPPRPQPAAATTTPHAQTQSQSGSHNGIMWAIGGAAAAALVLFFVMRGSDNPTPPATTPPAVTDASGQAGLAIPVPKPDDASANDGAREALHIQRACERGDIAACNTYVQRYPGTDFSRIAAQRATAQQPAADAGGVVWRREEPAAPVAADLSGRWQGFYQQGENRTPFAVQMEGRPGTFAGRMAETNTFADQRYPQLFANVGGQTRADGVVTFTKTYDGTAGQTHSVQYEGRIDDGGRTIRGTWRIDSLSGPFLMQRQ